MERETIEQQIARTFTVRELKIKHDVRFQNSYAYRVGCMNGRDARMSGVHEPPANCSGIQFGGRFSMNASIPSRGSGESSSDPNIVW